MTITPDTPDAMSNDSKPAPWDGVPLPAAEAPAPAAHLIRTDTLEEHGTVEQLSALYGALATASIDFEPVVKSASVSFKAVSYNYAPLASLVTATRKHLGKQGLVVFQPFGLMGNKDGCIITTLAHKDGGRLATTIHFTAQGDIKSLGGQTTYFRRYALCALLLLDGVDDADDREETIPTGQARRPRNQAPRPETRQRPPAARRAAPSKGSSQEEQPPPPNDEDAPGSAPPPPKEEGGDIEQVDIPHGASGQAMTDEQSSALKSEVRRTGIKNMKLGRLCQDVCGCPPSPKMDGGLAKNLLAALKKLDTKKEGPDA